MRIFVRRNLNLDVIVFPSQSERQIVKGNSVEQYPEELTGGITEDGVENIKKFVENGGKIDMF